MMLQISTILLITFTFIAFADGIVLHLWKYRLHLRPESRREHLLHTANALLFPFSVLPLFSFEAGGAVLWGSAALFALTMAIEFTDVASERDSRAALGGLTTFEYSLHFAMIGLRSAYTALACGSRPAGAWDLDAPWAAGVTDAFPRMVGWSVFISGLFVAGVHLWLARTRGTATASPSSGRGSPA